jgi:hypothetical protein
LGTVDKETPQQGRALRLRNGDRMTISDVLKPLIYQLKAKSVAWNVADV